MNRCTLFFALVVPLFLLAPASPAPPANPPKEWIIAEWTRIEAPDGHFALLGFGIPVGAGASMANMTLPQDSGGRLAPRLPLAAINLQSVIPTPPLFLPYYVLDGYQPIPKPTDTTFLVPNAGRWGDAGPLGSWFKTFAAAKLPDAIPWKAVGAGAVARHPGLGDIVNEPEALFNSYAIDDASLLITNDWKSMSNRTIGEATRAPLDIPLDQLFTSSFTLRRVASRPLGSLKIEILDLQLEDGGNLPVRGSVGIIGGPSPRPMHYGPHINEKDYETAAEGTPFTRLYELPAYLNAGTPIRWRLVPNTPLADPILVFDQRINLDTAAVTIQVNLDNRVGYGYTLYLEDAIKSPAEPPNLKSKAGREEAITRKQSSHIAQSELEEKLPGTGIAYIKLRFTMTLTD